MKPGPIQYATRALGAPVGWDREKHGDCDVLEIRDRDGAMESAWIPSDEEKVSVAAGRPVILTVWGASHPPVSVNAEALDPTQPAPLPPLEKLEALGRRGLVISICFGNTPKGYGYSVDCMCDASKDGFSRPFAARDFAHCLEIVEAEAQKRGWIK